MTDLGENPSGPKERDNRDKSLHGLMVVLTMAGIIAGSVILFAYASSDSPVPDGTASTVNEAASKPEKAASAEKVADEPADEPASTSMQSEDQEEIDDDLIPKRLLGLLDDVLDFEDDEKHDEKGKGKGNKGEG